MTNEIRKYKGKNNIKDDEHIKLNKIINLKSIWLQLNIFIIIIQKNKNLHEQLLNIKYINEDITFFEEIRFTRCNKL